MPLKYSDEQFIAAWKRLGTPKLVAEHLNLDLRGVYARRNAIEKRYGFILDTATGGSPRRPKAHVPKQGYRALAENITGTVIIGGDGHFWPGERSLAFGAMVELVKDLKPAMVIMNGDVFDGSRISRHPPGSWCQLPSVADELDAVKERLAEIESVAPEGCPLVLPAGNHDTRFSSRLAMNAPEYMGVEGFDLADHLGAWQFCWSIWLNGHTVVKHRWHQGVHGAYNNVLKGGKNIFTNHTHRLQATMYADYNGLRWGVECGTLSSFGPETDKYSYSEDSPPNWSEGLVVATFDHTGRLLEPEFCRVLDGTAYFRGQSVYSKGGAVKVMPQKKTKQKQAA
jgi:hypothetical protein